LPALVGKHRYSGVFEVTTPRMLALTSFASNVRQVARRLLAR
jgi:hypothetical protein